MRERGADLSLLRTSGRDDLLRGANCRKSAGKLGEGAVYAHQRTGINGKKRGLCLSKVKKREREGEIREGYET